MQEQENHKKTDFINDNVLKAHHIWNVISPQVSDLLGEEIFTKWFDDLIPITIENQKLILQTNATHASLWIKNNYIDTLNLLSGLQQENLKTQIIAPEEELTTPVTFH